jgi:hypothetical protein
LRSIDELTVNEPVECFYICWILLNAFLIRFDGHEFIILRFVALRFDKGSTTLHLLVAVAVIQLHFQGGKALVILLVQEQRTCCQQLEADVVGEQFVLQKERVHLLEVSISEVALAEQIDGSDVVVGEGD